MKTSTASFRKTALLWACLTFLVLGGCRATEHSDTPVERWGVFELVLDGPDSDTAYLDVTFAATFEGDGQSITAPGFYDGDAIGPAH